MASGILEIGIDKISALTDAALTAANVNSAMHSLVIDGIFTGVGSVLSFLPVIVTLFSSCPLWRIVDILHVWHL